MGMSYFGCEIRRFGGAGAGNRVVNHVINNRPNKACFWWAVMCGNG